MINAHIQIEVKKDGKVLPHVNIDTIYTKDSADIVEIANFIKSITPNAERIRVKKCAENKISDTWMVMDEYEIFATPISSWIKEKNPSTRLKNVLNKFETIEQITEKTFKTVKGSGNSTWSEFNYLNSNK